MKMRSRSRLRLRTAPIRSVVDRFFITEETEVARVAITLDHQFFVFGGRTRESIVSHFAGQQAAAITDFHKPINVGFVPEDGMVHPDQGLTVYFTTTRKHAERLSATLSGPEALEHIRVVYGPLALEASVKVRSFHLIPCDVFIVLLRSRVMFALPSTTRSGLFSLLYVAGGNMAAHSCSGLCLDAPCPS